MGFTTNVLRSAKSYRNSFNLPDASKLRWFPGHMNRGMKVMQQKLKSVDCVIEVHDARIPLSGRNPNFKDSLCGLRPHILVLNKVDLTDGRLCDKTVDELKKTGTSDVIYTDCKNYKCDGISKVLQVIKNISSNSRNNRSLETDLCALIIGVPNVGKSSLINALRIRYLKKSKAAAVGPIAGITRAVGTKIKVCESPLIYIYDTPGILTPSIPNTEVGMKLALCGTFKDTEVGLINIADFLLYTLNKRKELSYVSYLNLPEPTDNIVEALTLSAINLNMFLKRKDFGSGSGYKTKPDMEAAAMNFIQGFRKGTLGTFNLDLMCS